MTFDVVWASVGKIEREVNGPGGRRRQQAQAAGAGSRRKRRAALATDVVPFDGEVLVDRGANPLPGRPDPSPCQRQMHVAVAGSCSH